MNKKASLYTKYLQGLKVLFQYIDIIFLRRYNLNRTSLEYILQPPLDRQGFFIYMGKISFLIDGLNFYYSVVSVKKYTRIKAKWFNYLSLCEFYKKDLSKKLNIDIEINGIFYFTSIIVKIYNMPEDEYLFHKNNQMNYLRVLKDLGLQIEISDFKELNLKCPKCNLNYYKPIEKQTDVKIAAKIFEIFHKKLSDIIVIISGDTDLAPAIKTVKNLFPDKLIGVVIPYNNRSKELRSVSDLHYSIPAKKYINHLLPNPYELKTGEKIYKPETW